MHMKNLEKVKPVPAKDKVKLATWKNLTKQKRYMMTTIAFLELDGHLCESYDVLT